MTTSAWDYRQPDIVSGDRDSPFYHRYSSSTVIDEYSPFIKRYVDESWKPFFLSFTFKPLSNRNRIAQMADEVERVYSTLVTRVVRTPRSPLKTNSNPILIGIPDYPVRKHHKEPLNDPSINDGLHMHGILLIPPNSRLKENVLSHFNQHKPLYVQNRLLELDVKPIDTNLPRVVDYAFKSVKNGRVDLDDVLILPKADGELHHFEGKNGISQCSPEVPQRIALKPHQEDSPLLTRLPPGDHVIRFYLDRDNNGLARIIKSVRVHRDLPVERDRTVTCWEDSRINQLMDELLKAGIEYIFLRPPWVWRASKTGLACVHFFESSNVEARLVGKTCILMLNRHQMYAIHSFIGDLSFDEKRKLLDPNLPAMGIRIKVPKSSKAKITVGLAETSELLTLPAARLISSKRLTTYPFEGLDKVFTSEGNKLSESDLQQFRDRVEPYLDKIRRSKLTPEELLKEIDFAG
jgi:hypothetical protein